MKRQFSCVWVLFFCIMPFGVNAYVSEQISHSIIPLLMQLENTPPKNYSENYLLNIQEVLRQKTQKIRVVTYNVLFNLFDNQLSDQSYSWMNRLPKIVSSIENMQPDILCVQEAYPSQLYDLQNVLGNGFFHFIGEETQGELNAIFYNKNRFELDDTSDIPVSLFSASLTMPINPKDDAFVATISNFLPHELEPGRQLTLVHLRDKLTNKSFVVINTHLTFYRINSREDQANFIAELVKKLHALNKTVILTGDFNTFPNLPDRSFRFSDGSYICHIFQSLLKNTKDTALLGHIGPLASSIRDFLSRDHKPFNHNENPEVILDHIYVSPSVSVIINAIEPSLVNGCFPSDHMPVIADILLPR